MTVDPCWTMFGTPTVWLSSNEFVAHARCKGGHRIEYRLCRQKNSHRNRWFWDESTKLATAKQNECHNRPQLGWKRGVTMRAQGTFVVKIGPVAASDLAQEAGLGRMTMDKTFAGDLDGTSKGEMLTGGAESTGAMAYVALERVTATLNGQSGTFLLMHTASMLKSDPGSGVLQVTVVPHSGTEELAGLAGTMRITIADGKHHYDFEYQQQ